VCTCYFKKWRRQLGVVVILVCQMLSAAVYAAETVVAVSDKASTAQVEARLYAELATVYPGAVLYLGLQQQIIPNWHTYWQNPGDSGEATTIRWGFSDEAAQVSEIFWPTPERTVMGPITNYSYSGTVTLLSRLEVPASIQPGTVFVIDALVDWLVCEEECIPQQVQLRLSLPVVAIQSEATISAEGQQIVQQALTRLPVKSPWPVQLHNTDGQLELLIQGLPPEQIDDIWLYPKQWGRIQQSQPQQWQPADGGVLLKLSAGEQQLQQGELLDSVLVVTRNNDGQRQSTGYQLEPELKAKTVESVSFIYALLLALAGGVILNLMPCVFPVLSLKALSLLQQAHQSKKQIRLQGLVYTLGVLTSFAVLGLILILVKAGGVQIGWGFQFQSPLFVLAVAYLLFAVGLSLSGLYYLGGSISGLGSELAAQPGYVGQFFTGVLATVVATPCTAPFMAAALGYALVQPAPQLLAVFLALGLGLALPFLLLSYLPWLQRWLPKPGAWMDSAKQILAFPMYAAAIWLVWVLAQQQGPDAVLVALLGMLLLAIAAWWFNHSRTGSTNSRRVGNVATVLLVSAAFGFGYQQLSTQAQASLSSAVSEQAVLYSPELLQQLLEQDKAVFVNFTAAWCISCLVNERVALSTEAVQQHMKAVGITYLKGDWTNKDPAITQILRQHNRSGVPLYLYYPAGKRQPVELPQILTPDLVLSALR